MDTTNLLEVNDLKILLDSDLPPIINGISFNVKKGQVVGLLGESGVGKSLICLSMLRLLPPTISAKGKVTFVDKDILTLPDSNVRRLRGRYMGLIMQNAMAAFNPITTIGNQMKETILAHYNLSKHEIRERIINCLCNVKLENPDKILKQYPFELSGGMLQRVMIAMVLSLQPSIIIADEPTSALDTVTQHSIIEHLKNIVTKNCIGMLLVTHDLGVLAKMADEVIVIQDGNIVEQQSVANLFRNPEHPYTKQLLMASMKLRGEL